MSKTVRHYKRRVEAAAGQHATVKAWRSPCRGNAMRYDIDCRRCRIPNYWVKWRTGPGDFHSVMARWCVHVRTIHTNLQPPDYSVTITAADAEYAQRYLARWAKNVMEAAHLREIFA